LPNSSANVSPFSNRRPQFAWRRARSGRICSACICAPGEFSLGTIRDPGIVPDADVPQR
jgi:hypothetical protein